MKKLNAKKIIAGTIISMGLVIPLTTTSNALLSQPQTVEAATKKITLKHNAYLYNYRGRRVGRRKLYKNHTYTYYSIKRIHGKKYYRVGKNRYIKAGNVLVKRHTSKVNTPSNQEPESNSKLAINTSGMGTPKFQVAINESNADVFSASHATANGSWLGTTNLNGTYNVYAEDNGMYEIGNGQWVKIGIANVISNNSNKSTQTDQKDNKNVSANISSQSNSKVNNAESNKQSSQSNSNQSKNSKVVMTESQKEEVIRYFLQMLNSKREEEGAKPLILDSHLSQEATQRAVHDGTTLYNTGDEDHHRDENGNLLMPSDARAEVCSGIRFFGSTKQTAQMAFNGFIYNDADSNWEHKEILLSPSYTRIGLGVYFVNNQGRINIGSLVGDLN